MAHRTGNPIRRIFCVCIAILVLQASTSLVRGEAEEGYVLSLFGDWAIRHRSRESPEHWPTRSLVPARAHGWTGISVEPSTTSHILAPFRKRAAGDRFNIVANILIIGGGLDAMAGFIVYPPLFIICAFVGRNFPIARQSIFRSRVTGA